MEAREWCKCGNYQQMPTSLEYLCCMELSETKTMMEKAGLGLS